jgi:hypothetical protein
MKTTIEISDGLLEDAKQVAAEQNLTLRELVEEGLRQALEKRKRKHTFRLKKASFKGRGLQPGISEGDWESIREIVYQGRGA